MAPKLLRGLIRSSLCTKMYIWTTYFHSWLIMPKTTIKILFHSSSTLCRDFSIQSNILMSLRNWVWIHSLCDLPCKYMHSILIINTSILLHIILMYSFYILNLFNTDPWCEYLVWIVEIVYVGHALSLLVLKGWVFSLKGSLANFLYKNSELKWRAHFILEGKYHTSHWINKAQCNYTIPIICNEMSSIICSKLEFLWM